MASRRKKAIVLTGLLIVLPLCMLMMLLTILASLVSQQNASGCNTTGGALQAGYTGPGVGSLSPVQMNRAAAIVAVGRQMQLPDRGIVVALATASQESGFKVYANDGLGGDLAADQRGIDASLKLPHDAVGTDHGSLGVFQQQWPWWGSMNELMDPAASARKFYEALLKVPGWQSLDVTVAAQRVQRSAFPSAYADDQPLAEKLLDKLNGNVDVDQVAITAPGDNSADPATPNETVMNGVYVGGTASAAAALCTPAAVGYGGTWLRPVDGPVTSPYGWRTHPVSGVRKFHAGTDFGEACGTPFAAIGAGKVIAAGPASGYGHWIRIDHGNGTVSEYGHMYASGIKVTTGQQVDAGQIIGLVGSDGTSTGCHLHLTIEVNGQTTDPMALLGKGTAPGAGKGDSASIVPAAGSATGSAGAAGIRMASFNALGHSHTDGPRADRRGFRSSATRTREMVKLIESHDLELVGLQEFQPPQAKVFEGLTRGRWALFGNMDNVIAWRTDRFTLGAHRTFSIPYFNGSRRHMPLVQLIDRRGGASLSVLNVHNAADVAGPAAKWRRQAEAIELEEARREVSAGRSVVFTGDFNDREPTFCALTAGGLMAAAAGGSNAGKCTPPRGPLPIDWIFGARVGFSAYSVDSSPKTARTSDHPIVLATAIPGGSAASAPSELRALTYNIRHGRGGLDKLAAEISASGADVIALQEADDLARGADPAANVRALAARLGMQYAYTYVGTWKGRKTIDNAILSRYAIVGAGKDALPGADGTEPRGLLHVTIDFGGRRVDVFGTHLQQAGNIRLAQAQAVSTEIGRATCPTVLMGDLNFTPDLPMHPVITAHLTDTFAGRRYGAGKTVPSTSPRARIDYVLHDQATTVTSASVQPAGASDHRGVLVSLRPDPKESC